MYTSDDICPPSSDVFANEPSQIRLLQDELCALYYAVSHDFCAPIRSILGFSKALEEDFDECITDTQKHHLLRIEKNASKLESMAKELLLLHDLAQASLHIEPVDLGAILFDIINDYREKFPPSDISISIEQGVFIGVDRPLMTRALMQLVDNIWKFSNPKGQVDIQFGVNRDISSLTYHLKDNGIGFDMTYADRLFCPFQKLHSEETYPGLGVGLAIFHRIIRRFGGVAWADAEPNRGASIFFTLPLTFPLIAINFEEYYEKH